MTFDQVVTVLSTVIANGVLLISFRVSIEHRITRLETNVEHMMDRRKVAR